MVFPTDTVYGIGCNPYIPEALDRIYIAKGRPAQKAVPLLLSDASAITQVAGELTDAAGLLSAHLWPGGLTLIVQRKPDLPAQLGSGSTIGIRVPDHAALRAFIARCGGALAATSANRSGEPDALNVDEAVRYLGDHVSIFVDGGTSRGNRPSTVVDCTTSPPTIVRSGAVSSSTIKEILGDMVR